MQECSLGVLLPNWLKPFHSVEQNGRQGYKKKTIFKYFFLLKRWTDFEIISQECFLGNSLSKLLKPCRSVEQSGKLNTLGSYDTQVGEPGPPWPSYFLASLTAKLGNKIDF